MEKLTLKDLQDTYQEFEDYTYHTSLIPKVSVKAVAVAMRVLSERIEEEKSDYMCGEPEFSEFGSVI